MRVDDIGMNHSVNMALKQAVNRPGLFITRFSAEGPSRGSAANNGAGV